MINTPDYLRRFFINKQAVFVIRIFYIAIRGKCTYKLSMFTLHLENLAHLFRGRCSELLIKHTSNGYFKSSYRLRRCISINEWRACANKYQ